MEGGVALTLNLISINYSLMTPTTWLGLATSPLITGKIAADPILPLYDSLANQFSAWNPVSWDNCVVGLHIVYAWMPTMVDCGRPARLTPAGQTTVVKLFNDSRTRRLTDAELLYLKTNLSKNSLVGISKMLHFTDPNRFAIWDIRLPTAMIMPAGCRP